MDYKQTERLLQRKGLKKTKLRHALIRYFIKTQHAQSYADIKLALTEATDKSTLYRNLTAFEQAGLIHSINDHSGVTKYAFGEAPIQGNEHAHFVCEYCETVYCMDGLAPLRLDVPKGFKAKKVQTIIRGTCADC